MLTNMATIEIPPPRKKLTIKETSTAQRLFQLNLWISQAGIFHATTAARMIPMPLHTNEVTRAGVPSRSENPFMATNEKNRLATINTRRLRTVMTVEIMDGVFVGMGFLK